MSEAAILVMPLPAASKLVITESARKELLAISRQRNAPKGIVLRVNIVLGACEGVASQIMARRLSTSLPTVLLWRKSYEVEGLPGILEDKVRSGRPKTISQEREGPGTGNLEEEVTIRPFAL